MSLSQLLVDAYNKPDPKPYLFQVGQLVRLRKGRSNDGQTPRYWDGAFGRIEARYTTGIHKEHWYKIRHESENEISAFFEDELDARYRKAI